MPPVPAGVVGGRARPREKEASAYVVRGATERGDEDVVRGSKKNLSRYEVQSKGCQLHMLDNMVTRMRGYTELDDS